MAESHVVSALAKHRAEVAGAIEVTARRLRTSLDHLEVTFLLFHPDAKPRGIKPKRWYGDVEPSLRHEMARNVLDILRRAHGEWLTIREVALRLMADQGMDTGSTVLVRAMMRRNDKALRR